MFRAVMIVPTGIGAEIGGHSGDATAAARLLAATCDQLILHPNVVNASDLVDIPDNVLYVEGSMLDMFLAGDAYLRPVKWNRILVACNEASPLTVNAVNAAQSVYGVDARIVELRTPLSMRGVILDGVASGDISGAEALINQVMSYEFDALAVHTPVFVDPKTVGKYMKYGGVNPWGGIEAKLSKFLARELDVPVAHAPVEASPPEYGVSDPRLAPEMICGSHLVSVLRGLSRAPRLEVLRNSADSIGVEEVDVMVSSLCWGAPHQLCRDNDVPIMFVWDNRTTQVSKFYERPEPDRDCVVRNYLEAAGALTSIRIGRSFESVLRPLKSVEILRA